MNYGLEPFQHAAATFSNAHPAVKISISIVPRSHHEDGHWIFATHIFGKYDHLPTFFYNTTHDPVQEYERKLQNEFKRYVDFKDMMDRRERRCCHM